MSEQRVIQDADGNYYSLAPGVLVEAADGTYEVEEAALEAARLPDEVGGFVSDPIPGVDIIVTRKPPRTKATFMDFGLRPASPGGSSAPTAGW